MSYGFQVRKEDGVLQLVGDRLALAAIAKHVPDGAEFTINGHEPGPGTSPSGTIGINLIVRQDERAYFRGSASGSYNVEAVPKEV
jgi:hypothetical protein